MVDAGGRPGAPDLAAEPFIGVAVAVLLACLVLCWRLAKAWQEVRGYGQGQMRAQALAAPHGQAVRSGRATTDATDSRYPAPVQARGVRPADREEPDISVGEAMATTAAGIPANGPSMLRSRADW